MTTDTFESFAIVELFGHSILAGKVTEQQIAGVSFLRVDVPTVDGQEAFTKFFGGSAIYAITPTDEETATNAARGLQKVPIEVWKLHLPQLSAPLRDVEEDDEHPF